jgi:hypothetical protein
MEFVQGRATFSYVFLKRSLRKSTLTRRHSSLVARQSEEVNRRKEATSLEIVHQAVMSVALAAIFADSYESSTYIRTGLFCVSVSVHY